MTEGVKESFWNTLSINLPKGAPQLISIEKIKRPSGYDIPGFTSLCATIRYGDIRVQGFGEGYEQLAMAKAISEATERAVQKFYALKINAPESSNGWACHTSADLAIQSATLELIERDVALTNWESNGPFYELPVSLWPQELVTWLSTRKKEQEFSNLRILMSSNSNGACVSALLFNDTLNFVAGHASGLELNSTILAATAECMRAAHAALRLESFVEVMALHDPDSKILTSPGAHSLAYAYSKTLPKSIKMLDSKESEIHKIWNEHRTAFSNLDLSKLQIQVYQAGDLHVARVRSHQHRFIYWGTNCRPQNALNHHPHFVG